MMNVTKAVPMDILVVEDNPDDFELIAEAMKDSKILSKLHWVADGIEAMAFLRREGKYAEASRPGIVLLDLNLPKKDGRQVLAEIKSDEHLLKTPVIILSTSGSDEDISKAYGLHANCYITKPVDLDQFLKVTRSIENFWLTIASLPR